MTIILSASAIFYYSTPKPLIPPNSWVKKKLLCSFWEHKSQLQPDWADSISGLNIIIYFGKPIIEKIHNWNYFKK